MSRLAWIWYGVERELDLEDEDGETVLSLSLGDDIDDAEIPQEAPPIPAELLEKRREAGQEELDLFYEQDFFDPDRILYKN